MFLEYYQHYVKVKYSLLEQIPSTFVTQLLIIPHTAHCITLDKSSLIQMYITFQLTTVCSCRQQLCQVCSYS